MQLMLHSDEQDLLDANSVVCVGCEGAIAQDDFDPAKEPLRDLLGPLIFARKVLLNLERATYISSSGISWLIICHKHFVQGKGMLILHSIPPLVFQVLQLVRLPAILHIAPDEAAARAMAQGANP